MTNEELAELEREARHEMDIFDRPSIRTSLRLIEAIATAREAEALRAENARKDVALRKIATGEGIGGPDAELQCAAIARAALEQGEVK